VRQAAVREPGTILARIPQRWVLLDIEPLDRPGVEVVVGAEAAGMNTVDGAEVVDLVDVAGDAEGAYDFAGGVADELAARFEKNRPIGQFGERAHEVRLLFRFLQHLPR
jgi:hypothetical protein